MKIAGYVLFGVVLLAALYVFPYLSRRREVLAYSPVDDRFAEHLRLLEMEETPGRVIEGGETGSLLFRRPEVIMDENVEREASGIGDLVRARSRRKARLSQRAARRQRGWLGLGVLAAVAVLLLLIAAGGKLSWVPGIVVAVIAAMGGGFWAYLLTQMREADITDRNAIAEYNSDLSAFRGATSGTRRPAVRRPGTGAASIAEHEDSSLGAQEAHSDDEPGADLLERAASSEDDASPKAESRERTRGGVAPAAAARTAPTSKRSRDERATGAARAERVAHEERGVRSKSDARGAGVARAESGARVERAEKRIVRRSISPYIPPAYESAPVPYRPKRVGESLAEPEHHAGERSSRLVGRDVLDEAMRRRRA